jgi:hypothetical protein
MVTGWVVCGLGAAGVPVEVALTSAPVIGKSRSGWPFDQAPVNLFLSLGGLRRDVVL